jgi:CubicO group peptidase (beta-lactamase class C family)
MKAQLASLILILIIVFSCSNTGKSPLAGRWEATDMRHGETDLYVFTIKEKKPGVFAGQIETRMGGAALPAMPINQIEYEHPNFRFVVNSGDMVITYSGKISDDLSQLIGCFEYSNPEIPKKELTLSRKTPYNPVVAEYKYMKPTSDEFSTASIDEAKLDVKIMDKLLQKTAQGEFGEINSLIILKNGKLVVEEHYNGFKSNQLHQLQSCTKSLTSLLVGIAIDKGFIKSVDDKLLLYLPDSEYAAGWENVTIRHLLTMSSGVEWIKDDPNSPWDKDEGIASILLKPAIGNSGVGFNYNSAMQVLAGVLVNATRMELEKFAEQNLFQPLKIDNYKWQKSEMDSLPICTGALKLRSLDMAKIGQMVLQGGHFKGNQVISENWISESTKVQIEVPNNKGDHYGFLWWVGTKSPQIIYAHGMGSQFIFIVPDMELVMVTTGNNFNNNKHLSPFEMLNDFVLRSVE